MELVAVMVRFDEQVRLIGGRTTVIWNEQLRTIGGDLTVTWNEQLVEPPHESLATQVTVVVPIGKVLPLGGLQFTIGGLHPPEAVLV